jgi:hypothetical protein
MQPLNRHYQVSEFVEMYPTELSKDFCSNKVWRAERAVFAALASQLEGLFWTVFHHAGITCQSKGGRWFRSEIDFLCCHFIDGLLVIEVKGGQVQVDQGQWKVRSLSGGEFEVMKYSPTQQAKSCIRRVLERLSDEAEIQSVLGTDDTDVCQRLLKRHVGFAVCFPDLTVSGDLTADLPRDFVIDKVDLNNIEERISQILSKQCRPIKGRELPVAIKTVLRRLLAPSIAIPQE